MRYERLLFGRGMCVGRMEVFYFLWKVEGEEMGNGEVLDQFWVRWWECCGNFYFIDEWSLVVVVVMRKVG